MVYNTRHVVTSKVLRYVETYFENTTITMTLKIKKVISWFPLREMNPGFGGESVKSCINEMHHARIIDF